jgi:hypothetical protein
MAKRRLVRLGAIGACSLLALALTSCLSPVRVTVDSVTGQDAPYNPDPTMPPKLVPAELVKFTATDFFTSPSNPLVCTIDVYEAGAMVGTDLVAFGYLAGAPTPSGVQYSDLINITSQLPFDGTPSDATVSCMSKGV